MYGLIHHDESYYDLVQSSQTCRIQFSLGLPDKDDPVHVYNLMPWVYCREYFNEFLPAYHRHITGNGSKAGQQMVYGYRFRPENLKPNLNTDAPLVLSMRDKDNKVPQEVAAEIAANLLQDLLTVINPNYDDTVWVYLTEATTDPRSKVMAVTVPEQLSLNPLLLHYYTWSVRFALGVYITNGTKISSLQELSLQGKYPNRQHLSGCSSGDWRIFEMFEHRVTSYKMALLPNLRCDAFYNRKIATLFSHDIPMLLANFTMAPFDTPWNSNTSKHEFGWQNATAAYLGNADPGVNLEYVKDVYSHIPVLAKPLLPRITNETSLAKYLEL